MICECQCIPLLDISALLTRIYRDGKRISKKKLISHLIKT